MKGEEPKEGCVMDLATAQVTGTGCHLDQEQRTECFEMHVRVLSLDH